MSVNACVFVFVFVLVRACAAGATLSAMVFLLFVYLLFKQLEFLPIFLSVLAQGFFSNAAAPIALELGASIVLSKTCNNVLLNDTVSNKLTGLCRISMRRYGPGRAGTRRCL